MFKVEGGSTPINVMFNPKEYKISRGMRKSDKRVPGKDKHKKQFIHGENDTLSLSLFFDTYATGITNSVLPEAMKKDVRNETNKIYKLMDTGEHLHKPPKVTFCMGGIQVRRVYCEHIAKLHHVHLQRCTGKSDYGLDD